MHDYFSIGKDFPPYNKQTFLHDYYTIFYTRIVKSDP